MAANERAVVNAYGELARLLTKIRKKNKKYADELGDLLSACGHIDNNEKAIIWYEGNMICHMLELIGRFYNHDAIRAELHNSLIDSLMKGEMGSKTAKEVFDMQNCPK